MALGFIPVATRLHVLSPIAFIISDTGPVHLMKVKDKTMLQQNMWLLREIVGGIKLGHLTWAKNCLSYWFLCGPCWATE